jgi:hypothetical protein
VEVLHNGGKAADAKVQHLEVLRLLQERAGSAGGQGVLCKSLTSLPQAMDVQSVSFEDRCAMEQSQAYLRIDIY